MLSLWKVYSLFPGFSSLQWCGSGWIPGGNGLASAVPWPLGLPFLMGLISVNGKSKWLLEAGMPSRARATLFLLTQLLSGLAEHPILPHLASAFARSPSLVP